MKATLDDRGAVLTLHDGTAHFRFHAIWLRDNAQDDQTRSPANGQRLIALGDIAADVAMTAARVEGDQVVIRFAPEGREIAFAREWLLRHAYDRGAGRDAGWLPGEVTPWTSANSDILPRADHGAFMSDAAVLRDWLAGMARYGVGVLTGGPAKSGDLLAVIERFGYVRETNYGRWFEVRTEVNPSNLAFTSLGLQAHTDNPYRDPVPTLQLLYCLENSATGGENMVVDGFAVARRLRDEDERAFSLLSSYCARFEYAGEAGVCLRSRRPMIELTPDGELIAVRFNNRSAAPITDVPFDDMADFYAAYRRFAELVDDPDMALEFKLLPGDCFLVDNTRVMHARRGYSGAGSRWLQGCYADKDGLLSTLAALQAGSEEAAQ